MPGPGASFPNVSPAPFAAASAGGTAAAASPTSSPGGGGSSSPAGGPTFHRDFNKHVTEGHHPQANYDSSISGTHKESEFKQRLHSAGGEIVGEVPFARGDFKLVYYTLTGEKEKAKAKTVFLSSNDEFIHWARAAASEAHQKSQGGLKPDGITHHNLAGLEWEILTENGEVKSAYPVLRNK